MHTEFAARIEQSIDNEQPKHLLPAHRFTAFGQTLLPELIQTQLLPEFTCQPAAAEDARTLQFQPAQPYLHAVDGVGGKIPIVGKQAHRGEALFGFVKHFKRLAPRRLLPVVDLTEIENSALRRLAAGHAPVFNNAEVAMIFAVLAAIRAAQKHLSAAECQRSKAQKRGKVFTWPVLASFGTTGVESKRNFPARRLKMAAKCESRAKILPVLDEVDYCAVVTIVADTEIHIMTARPIALDDDLVA